MNTLTKKQNDFVLNYIKNGFNASQAALDAGYSKALAQTNSHSLLRNPIVFERISGAYDVVERERFDQICMTIYDRAKVLNRIIRDAVPIDDDQPIKQHYVGNAIRAIQELNKMSGDYAPDKRLSITVDATQKRLNEAKKAYEDY